MHYVGGKGRVAAKLAACILARAKGAAVVEPFCGALAMTEQLQPALASDVSRPVMTLIRAVRSGWNPPSEVSEQLYRDCKARKGRRGRSAGGVCRPYFLRRETEHLFHRSNT